MKVLGVVYRSSQDIPVHSDVIAILWPWYREGREFADSTVLLMVVEG